MGVIFFVLIVAECNVNVTRFLYFPVVFEVLIVAECNVNFEEAEKLSRLTTF